MAVMAEFSRVQRCVEGERVKFDVLQGAREIDGCCKVIGLE